MRRLGVISLVALLACGCGRANVATIVRVAPDADVSNARDAQSEVSVAASLDGRTLLAGSNEGYGYSTRAYGSVDGGRSWVSRLDPELPHPETGCAFDPAVAIDAGGRQYFAFLEADPCGKKKERVSLYVATRPWAGGVWSTPSRPIAVSSDDDHPSIAIDRTPDSPHYGRIYIAWARQTGAVNGAVVAHSDDHGRSWSAPRTVNDTGANAFDANVTVAANGVVYIVWQDLDGGFILVDRSVDGGETFGTDHVAGYAHGYFNPKCDIYGIEVRAQDVRCSRPDPTVTVDTSSGPYAGRVFVTYTDVTTNGAHDVFVTAFDAKLEALFGYPLHGHQHRATPPESHDRRSDQFMAVSATDPASGALWICFYDTTGDVVRYTTRFSCVASRDGGRTFTRPFRAARQWSDETVPDSDSNQYGDYQGLVVSAGKAHPVWTDSRKTFTRGEEIYATTLRLGSQP
jgi:hypothetical protein